MAVNLRVAAADWEQLRKHCRTSFRAGFPPETGAIALLGKSEGQRASCYLVAEVLWPQAGELKVAEHGQLVFGSHYIRRAHVRMRERGLAGIAFIHTHPRADETVEFSWYDDQQEPGLVENLMDICPDTRVVSIVLGKRSQCGREWIDAGHRRQMGHLILVGGRLECLPLNGQPKPPAPTPAATFDRGSAITGAGALARLKNMTIAVVGASGTGSVMCELLARAGCGRLIIIDDDIVKDVNLNRILYATIEDVRLGRAKVDVLQAGIEGLGFGCVVSAIRANVAHRSVLLALRDADVIVGCVDRALPRFLLSEFAYRYLLPYIDVGTEIDGDEKGIVSVIARCSYVSTGRPCLVCSGIVQPDALRIESLAAEERERVIAQGYSKHLLLAQPAVMDLNMRASSMGTVVLRHLLQPFMHEPIPVTISENLVTLRMLAINEARAATPNCRLCGSGSLPGIGDCGPPIGFGG
jgi:molybdopterin/thiamine biosynthesis adenylyltransferase